jgi:hypothetical protein
MYRKNPRFGWNDYLKWSHFDVKLANHDETEYDLYYCINNGGGKSSDCSLDHGDVSQPIILYRSNRVYLCHYEKQGEGNRAHQELRNILGVNASADLYEVAGCLLRLALWPTKELWHDIDESYYQDLYSRILHQEKQSEKKEKDVSREKKERKLRRQLLEKGHQEIHYLMENESLFDFSGDLLRKRRNLFAQQQETEKKSKFRFGDEPPPEEIAKEREQEEEEDRQIIFQHPSHHHYHNHQSSSSSSASASPSSTVSSSSQSSFFQIGVHFRCGDHGYAHQANEYDCAYDPGHHSENSYMLEGNPYELSLCVNELLHNHTLELIQNHRVIMSGEKKFFFHRCMSLFVIFLSFFCLLLVR